MNSFLGKTLAVVLVGVLHLRSLFSTDEREVVLQACLHKSFELAV